MLRLLAWDSESQASSRFFVAALWLLVVLYAATFSALSIHRHAVFETHGYDLGNVDQTVYNTLHGCLFCFTNMDGIEMDGLESRLALHFEPVLLPVSLTYLLYSSPVTLLVLQTVVLALGAWPAFLLARERLKSDFAGLVFAAAYLLFPALEAANLFDFHAVTLAAPCLLAAFYFLQKRAYRPFALFAVLTMSCKEDMCFLVAALGLYIIVVQRERRAGLWTVLGAGLWFWLAVFVITPPFSPMGANIHLRRYAYLGDTPWEMLKTIVGRPGVIVDQLSRAGALNYLKGLLLPLAFLPLLSPLTLALALPSLAVNLLSENAFMHRLEEFHYGAPLVPFILVSGVYGLETLSGTLSRWLKIDSRRLIYLLLALVLVVSLGYHYCRGFSPLAAPFRWPPLTAHHRLAQKFIDMIPPDAVLSAQINLNPHVSQRRRVYQVVHRDDIEYVFLDVSTLPNKDHVHGYLQDWIETGEDFGVVASEDGYILLRRGAPHKPLSDDFYSFVTVDNPAIQYPMTVDFGSNSELNSELNNERSLLRFLGFDVLYNREEEVSFNLYWTALREVERDYLISLYLLDEAGNVTGSTDQPQPVTVWHPTSHWQPGETVRVVANTLSWWTRDRARYGIALGVVDGPDPWEIGRRLKPQVRETDLAPRLMADGTVLRLLEFGKRCGMPRGIEARRVFARPKVQREVGIDLGGVVRLVGCDLAARVKAGDTLRLTLYWQALAKIEEDYTVFTHLLDEEGRVFGGKDNPPVRGTAPTGLWLEGEFIQDVYEIAVQPDAPAGEYTVEVGLYEARSGQRLSVDGRDRVLLGPVQVERFGEK